MMEPNRRGVAGNHDRGRAEAVTPAAPGPGPICAPAGSGGDAAPGSELR